MAKIWLLSFTLALVWGVSCRREPGSITPPPSPFGDAGPENTPSEAGNGVVGPLAKDPK
jgi:hypothetical protein